MWFKKPRLETPFKGDDVKALVKTGKTWSFISLRKLRKMQHMLCFFGFQCENGFGFLQCSEIPTLPVSLKIKRHFSTAAAFGNSVFFKWKILSDDRRFYLHDSK